MRIGSHARRKICHGLDGLRRFFLMAAAYFALSAFLIPLIFFTRVYSPMEPLFTGETFVILKLASPLGTPAYAILTVACLEVLCFCAFNHRLRWALLQPFILILLCIPLTQTAPVRPYVSDFCAFCLGQTFVFLCCANILWVFLRIFQRRWKL